MKTLHPDKEDATMENTVTFTAEFGGWYLGHPATSVYVHVGALGISAGMKPDTPHELPLVLAPGTTFSVEIGRSKWTRMVVEPGQTSYLDHRASYFARFPGQLIAAVRIEGARPLTWEETGPHLGPDEIAAMVAAPETLVDDEDEDEDGCPFDDADECHAARERAAAGVSNDIPDCPVHGTHPDVKTLAQYRAVTRSGIGCMGYIKRADVAAFVEQRWNAHWRELKVEFNGHQVGGIGMNEGRRVWWAES